MEQRAEVTERGTSRVRATRCLGLDMWLELLEHLGETSSGINIRFVAKPHEPITYFPFTRKAQLDLAKS